MASTSSAARVYAQGLYQVGLKHKAADSLGEELEAFAGLLRSDRKFRAFLFSPGIPADEKRKVLAKALTGKTSQPFLNFLQVLVDKRRQGDLPAIAREYQKLLDKGSGVVRGEMVYAFPDTNGSLPEMEALMGRKLGKTVKLRRREDPALLGGVVVKIGDLVLDGSLDRKLKTLRQSLLGRGGMG